MKKLILILYLLILYTSISKAQSTTHSLNNMTFSLPTEAVKIDNSSLAPYSEVQQKFVHLPNTYKINEVYIGFSNLKKAQKNRDSLEVFKANRDYDMNNEFNYAEIYNSKIETINNNDVYSEYTFCENFGDYNRNIGEYFFMVYNYNIKKLFTATVAFENQSNYAAATKILYDFLNSVSFPAYVNTTQSVDFYRNCFSSTAKGSLVTITADAGSFTSRISQADADAQALSNCMQYGQFQADTFGTCTYFNTAKSGIYTKNDCDPSSIGSAVTYTVNAGKHSGGNQYDADKRALDDLAANGQSFANANGTCKFKNKTVSKIFTKNTGCPIGKVGSNVTYTIREGLYTSDVSQAEADARASAGLESYGPSYANTYGTCGTYKSALKSKSFTRSTCLASTPETVVFTVIAGKYTSDLSQSDADAKAQAEVNNQGQQYANINGTCTFKSKALTNVPFTKQCTPPSIGTTVNYSSTVGAFTSIISQADADAKAIADAQAYANANGTCN